MKFQETVDGRKYRLRITKLKLKKKNASLFHLNRSQYSTFQVYMNRQYQQNWNIFCSSPSMKKIFETWSEFFNIFNSWKSEVWSGKWTNSKFYKISISFILLCTLSIRFPRTAPINILLRLLRMKLLNFLEIIHYWLPGGRSSEDTKLHQLEINGSLSVLNLILLAHHFISSSIFCENLSALNLKLNSPFPSHLIKHFQRVKSRRVSINEIFTAWQPFSAIIACSICHRLSRMFQCRCWPNYQNKNSRELPRTSSVEVLRPIFPCFELSYLFYFFYFRSYELHFPGMTGEISLKFCNDLFRIQNFWPSVVQQTGSFRVVERNPAATFKCENRMG